jgi:hypothetical protein
MLTKPVRDQHCVIGSLRRGLSDGVGVSRILWRGRNAWDRFEIFHRPHERRHVASEPTCNSRQAQRSVNSAVIGQEPTDYFRVTHESPGPVRLGSWSDFAQDR